MREVYGRQWRHVKKFVKKFFDDYIIEKSENNFFVLSPSEFKAQYNIIQQYPKITRL